MKGLIRTGDTALKER